jgi:hypothetical protein
MFCRRSVSLSLVYGLGKTCSYFFRPVFGGYMFRRRSFSLSLVYGLSETYFLFLQTCPDFSRRRSVSLSFVYGLSLTLFFISSDLSRLLSQTIRLPLFSLWFQFNFFVFLQTCLRRKPGQTAPASLKDDPSPSL